MDQSSERPTPLPPEALESLLDRYLAGEANAEECERARAWLAQHPNVEGELRDAVNYAATSERGDRHAELWDTMVARIAQGDQTTAIRAEASSATVRRKDTGRVSKARPFTRFSRIAIAATLSLGVVIFGARIIGSHRTDASLISQAYHAAPGHLSTVRLADGSVMTLGPSTTVSRDAQTIAVTGEAYFVVAPHPDRPFIVKTTHALVTVLGTRFAVRQYPGESQSRVVVEEGRVALSRIHSPSVSVTPAVLSAHMLALVSDSVVTVSSAIPAKSYTSWTQGTLVFDRVPLRDVVIELSRVYGASIRIADSSLVNTPVVAEVEFEKRPLPQILDAIGLSMNARCVRSGSAFVLVRGRSAIDAPSRSGGRDHVLQQEKEYGR